MPRDCFFYFNFLGRFEIESEHNNSHFPLINLRKLSYLNGNNHEEIVNLMPIDEQDETEQQTTLTSF